MRALSLEARRSPAVPLLPLLVAVCALLPMARHLQPVALWPTRMLDLQFTLQILGPFAGGLAAWVASRDGRRGMVDLVASVPYPPWRRTWIAWAANAGWTVLFYLAVAAVFITLGAVQATWGGPLLWPPAVALLGTLMCAAVGFAAGTWLPGRFVAPLVGTGLFGLLGVAIAAGQRQVRAAWLTPIFPSVGGQEGVFWPVRWDLAVVQLLFAGGLLVAALGVAGLRGGVRGGVLAATAVGVALVVAAGALIGTARVDERGVLVPALHDARSDRPLPYTPVCAGAPLTVCLHPAYRRELAAMSAFVNRVVAPIAGLPGVPARVDQASSAHRAGVSGAVVTMDVPVIHTASVPSDVATLTAGTLTSALVIGELDEKDGRRRPAATPAQRALQWFLIRAAGYRPDQRDVSADPAERAAGDRLAALGPADQRAWLVAHFPAVRAGAPVALADFR
jgi:hypothetical protein